MSTYQPTVSEMRQHIDAEAQLLGLTEYGAGLLLDMVRCGRGPKLRGLLSAMENLEAQRAKWNPPPDMEAA